MTNATKSRLLYVVVLGICAAIALGIVRYVQSPQTWLVAMALVLLIPGRLPRVFWRRFFQGRRELARGEYDVAEASFRAFLADLRRRPWLKKLIFLNWGIHTWNVEAMTLNNLGSALSGSGELDAALACFREAVEIDPRYGIPVGNMAVIHFAKGEDAMGDQLIERARALGNHALTAEAARRMALGERG